MFARVAGATPALVTPISVPADSVVANIGILLTLIYIAATICPGVARQAGAPEAFSRYVVTCAAVATWRPNAFIYLFCTLVPLEARGTATLVVLHQVHTVLVFRALIVLAVIRVVLAVVSLVARSAGAAVLGAHTFLLALLVARRPVETGCCCAGVIGLLAGQAHVPRAAPAGVGIHPVNAITAVPAGGRATLVHILLTFGSCKTGGAVAGEGVYAVDAGAVVLAHAA